MNMIIEDGLETTKRKKQMLSEKILKEKKTEKEIREQRDYNRSLLEPALSCALIGLALLVCFLLAVILY